MEQPVCHEQRARRRSFKSANWRSIDVRFAETETKMAYRANRVGAENLSTISKKALSASLTFIAFTGAFPSAPQVDHESIGVDFLRLTK
jgi:hypothetical protein